MPYIASGLYFSEGRSDTGHTLLERFNFLRPRNKSNVNASQKLNFVFLLLKG